MNKEILETYLTIVRTRSLTKTAEQMFISQSAVSNRLFSLESELDTRLMDRSPGQREIVLTQRGEEFVEFAKRYLELEHQISDWGNGSITQVLKVASVISLTDHILKGFYRQLLRSKSLSIVLSTHWTDRIISMLESREIDIGITPRVFYAKSVTSIPLFDESLYLISSKTASDYPECVSLRDLNRSNEIYFDWGPSFVEWHDSQINPLEPPLILTDTTEVIAELLSLPGAFGIVPASVFKSIENRELKLSQIIPPPPCRTCYLLKPRGQTAGKGELISCFEKELLKYLQQQKDIVLHER